MTKTTTVLEVTYRASGYDAADLEGLRIELEPLGAIRLRPLHLPQAGGSFELWLVLNYIGSTMLNGIIEHIAGNQFDRLSASLRRFFMAKRTKSGFDPELSVRVTYDDVDWDIGPLNEDQIVRVPELARTVLEHLQKAPLRDAGVTRIAVGMIRDGDQWHEPHLHEWPEDTRFWGISLEGHRAITHIYDTETCLFAERPPDTYTPTGRDGEPPELG